MSDIKELDKLIEAVEEDQWRGTIQSDKFDTMGRRNIIRAYNCSLDAAKALHDALLPGWLANLEIDRNFAVVNSKRGLRQRGFSALSSNPARAWLLSILKAYRTINA